MYARVQFFAATAPADWQQILGFLAVELHFQPSELWEMTEVDMVFWMARYEEIVERRKG